MTEILLQVALNTITRPFMNLTMTGNTHSKVKYKYVYKNNYGYAENYFTFDSQFPQLRNSYITMVFSLTAISLFDDLQRNIFKIVNVPVPNINTDKNNFQSNTKFLVILFLKQNSQDKLIFKLKLLLIYCCLILSEQHCIYPHDENKLTKNIYPAITIRGTEVGF
jgi:hypothetical protein